LTARRRDETTPHEIVNWILPVDGRQAGDRLAAARDNNLGTPLNASEMFAQPVVKLPDAHLVLSSM
jgi:hypothetical protein